MTNITDMCPSTRVRDGGRSTGDRHALVVTSSRFPVASLVTTQSLVRGKDLVAKRTLEGGLGGDGRLKQGTGVAAGEHDETESKILFFGRRSVKRWAAGTLALGPGLEGVEEGDVMEMEGGIESLEWHS